MKTSDKLWFSFRIKNKTINSMIISWIIDRVTLKTLECPSQSHKWTCIVEFHFLIFLIS